MHGFARLAHTFALMLVACGSDDEQRPGPGTGGTFPATGGAGGPASGGGAVAGGVPGAGGLTGSGGTTAATGGAPPSGASLGECFEPDPGAPQTCRGYCEGRGKTCVEKGCMPDGSPTPAGSGYTWVTFEKAACPASQIQKLSSFDSCVAPFELSVQIPDGQVLRCCCGG